jgi:hypothetical protein
MGFKRHERRRGVRSIEELRAERRKKAEEWAAWLRPMLEKETDWDLATGARAVGGDEDYGLMLRAVTRLTKKAVRLMYPGRKCSVRRDRGTAYGWVNVDLELPSAELKSNDRSDSYRYDDGSRDAGSEMRDTLIALGIDYAKYLPDSLPGKDEWTLCLSVEVSLPS